MLIPIQARQGVYEWRSDIQDLAIRIIGAEIKERGLGTQGVKDFADDALKRGGELVYSGPNIEVSAASP